MFKFLHTICNYFCQPLTMEKNALQSCIHASEYDFFKNNFFLQNTDWVHQKCIFPTCWKFNKTRHVWWIWFRNWNSSYYAILRIMIIFSLTSHFKSEVLFWVYVCRLSWCDPSLWGNLLIRAGKSKSLTCWKRLKGWKGQNSSDSTVSTDSSISPVSHDSPIS